MHQWRAVVVYSRVGGGHVSAARALATELSASGRCAVRLVDAYVDCGRFPVTRFPQVYAQLARHYPRLWSAIYGTTSSVRGLDPAWVVGKFVRGGFARLMQAERPDVVVCVLPAINGLLRTATAAVEARLEVVLTDWHAVHPFWVAPGVDHYWASTDSARADLVRYGAPPEAVEVAGIPVRREFSVASPERTPHERFAMLAMVGAEGSPRSLRNIAALAHANLDAELVVVCGRSERLRRRVERLPVRALGFVEDIAGLMRASDLLVTKAGGVTLAEAFCQAMPVVIHDVLAGQETGNLEYALERSAVAYAPTPGGLVQAATELANDPDRRAALAAHGARLARPDAARVIAQGVLARLETSGPKLGRHAEA